MTKPKIQMSFETFDSFSVKEIQNYFEPILDKNNLKFANWMFEHLGFDSFFHYIKLDLSNLLEANQDPTKAQNTRFVKALTRLKNEMSNPLEPKKIFVFIKMWVQSKRLEKLTIQLFTHLYSHIDTREAALELKNTLEVNNAFHKTQDKNRNIDFTIESIDSIVNAAKLNEDYISEIQKERVFQGSNDTYIENKTIIQNIENKTIIQKIENKTIIQNFAITQNFTEINNTTNNFVNCQNESVDGDISNHQALGLVYLKCDFSQLSAFAVALESHGFIQDSNSFIELLKKKNTVIYFEKVVWLKKLSTLVFFIQSMMVLNVIPISNEWAILTSNNFISLSKRKKNPEISPKVLISTKEKMKLSGINLNGLLNDKKFQEDNEINLIRQILLQNYYKEN